MEIAPTTQEAPMPADPTVPCGHCRRCAVHDDPGGCLTVQTWEREQEDRQNLVDLVTPAEEWPPGWHATDEYDPDVFETPEPTSNLYLIEL